MKKQLILAALFCVLCGAAARAADMDAAKYLDIDETSVKIEETDGEAGAGNFAMAGPFSKAPAMDADAILGTIDRIINLADKLWSIIEKGKPVAAEKVSYANAVPSGITHWSQLQGWSRPSVKRYEFSAKNMLGLKAVSVIYQVHWTHGGNFQGKGKFLTGVSVEPILISVPLGYGVDLNALVPDMTVANIGTQDDPVASMQVQLSWTISTPFKVIKEKAVYYVQGDGFIQEIGSPFTRSQEERSALKAGELDKKLGDVKF
jgi:hypothetical protein